MIVFAEATAALKARGYTDANVEEKLAQDVLLDALSRSGFRENVTVKGGFVMANLTGDIRRTTLDIDVDFVRYGIDDESIRAFVRSLDRPDGVSVSVVGDIVELRQQDYRGKDVFDMVYLADRVDRGRLLALIGSFVFDDPRMLENDLDGILRRVRRTFADRNYAARLAHRRSNWLQIDPSAAMERLYSFLESLKS